MDKKIYFSAFAIFYTIFFRVPDLTHPVFGWINNLLVLSFVIVNIGMFKCTFLTQYKYINICAIIWAIINIYTGYVNQDLFYDLTDWKGEIEKSYSSMRFDHVIYYVIKFLSCILYYQFLSVSNKEHTFIRYFFFFMFMFAVVSDINAIIYQSESGSGYLVGNKFYVSYINLFVVTLYYMLHPVPNRTQKMKLKLLLLLSFIIALKTQCSTVVIGTIILYYLIFAINDKWKGLLRNWKTYALGLVVFDILFFFFTMAFIDNPIMRYIIVDILGEDMTLTGRLDIYAALGPIIAESPLWGNGVGNATMITIMNGAGINAQNGLLNYLLEVGILGVSAFLFMLFLMMKNAYHHKNTYPILCFIYMMLVLSSIEVTFTPYFFGMCFLLLLNNNASIKTNTIRA